MPTSNQACIASHLRVSIVVSISACHADDPGSIPGRGTFSCVVLGAIGTLLELSVKFGGTKLSNESCEFNA